MKTNVDVNVLCPHCGFTMHFLDNPEKEKGVRFTTCVFEDCPGNKIKYRVKMLEVDIEVINAEPNRATTKGEYHGRQ